MAGFIDVQAKEFSDKWFAHIWQKGGDITDFHHEEALFYGVNRAGMDLTSYQMFRDLLLRSFVFESNDVIASTLQDNAIQSIGTTDVRSKRSGQTVTIAGAHYLQLLDSKIIASVGFLDHRGLEMMLDPVDDRHIIEMFTPT